MKTTWRGVCSVSTAGLCFRARCPGKILSTVASLLLLSACSQRSQELDEQVTVLQKELDQTEAQLQAANQSLKAAREELAHLKGTSGRPSETAATPAPVISATSSLPARETLERSYTEQAKALKQRLQEKLQNYSVGTCTLRSITVASPEYPVSSTISISVRSSGGSSFQLDVPAKADPNGKWSFPETSEIVERIEEIGRSSVQTSSRPSETSATSSRGADRTAIVRWPETSAGQRQSNAVPPPREGTQVEPPAAGAESKGPAANRTFVVQWPDGANASGQRKPANPPNEASGANQKKVPPEPDVLAQF